MELIVMELLVPCLGPLCFEQWCYFGWLYSGRCCCRCWKLFAGSRIPRMWWLVTYNLGVAETKLWTSAALLWLYDASLLPPLLTEEYLESGLLVDKQTYIQRDTDANRQTYRETQTQTDSQTDTDRQTNTHTETDLSTGGVLKESWKWGSVAVIASLAGDESQLLS